MSSGRFNPSSALISQTHAKEKEMRTEARRYLVEEVESFHVGLFSVEKLFGDVQELLSL